MSREALLNYATPPQYPQAPRANWLAVFSFFWTFAVAAPVMIHVLRAGDGNTVPLRPPGVSSLEFLLLVINPAVAVLSGYVATERGAPWDSPYRATGLAVCAVPVAWVMAVAGAMLCFGIV
jgi:hypothetical protein